MGAPTMERAGEAATSAPRGRPADPAWTTWCDDAGYALVEEDVDNGTRIYLDGAANRHIVMRAETTVVLPTGPSVLRCTYDGCPASVLLTDPPTEDAKGWQVHPVLGARCRSHPWRP